MSEELLFYEDAYLKEFDAVVVDVLQKGEKQYVVLDKTAFYPEGGGQTGDSGWLYFGNGLELNVEYTRKKEDRVLHEISGKGEILKAGDRVRGVIDWDRRFDHMQQHSGEHIVSGMICRRFSCDNVGFHMGADAVTIDFNAEISFEELLEIETEANRYISEDHPFISMWPSPEELKKLDYRSKKELSGEVRIACFQGADMCACCGTHVSGSAQVGMVKFASAEKFHDGTRIEVRFGKRAFDHLAMNYAQNKAIGVLLSAKEDKTFDYVKKQAEELAETRYRLGQMEEKMIGVIAAEYKKKKDTLIIVPPNSPEYVRKLAGAVHEQNGCLAAVFAGEARSYKYAVAGPDSAVPDLNRSMTAELSGRGGGRGGFAQGSVASSEEDIRRFWRDHIREVK